MWHTRGGCGSDLECWSSSSGRWTVGGWWAGEPTGQGCVNGQQPVDGGVQLGFQGLRVRVPGCQGTSCALVTARVCGASSPVQNPNGSRQRQTNSTTQKKSSGTKYRPGCQKEAIDGARETRATTRERNAGNAGGCWRDSCDGRRPTFELWFFVLSLYVTTRGKTTIADPDFRAWDLELGDGGKGAGELQCQH